jgi:hypothetical protein
MPSPVACHHGNRRSDVTVSATDGDHLTAEAAMRIARPILALFATPLLVAACSSAGMEPSGPNSTRTPGASPSVTPEATPQDTPLGSQSPSISQPAGTDGVVVTIRTAGDEEYRILLTDPEDIAVAEALLAGEEAPRIPNGMIVRGGDGGVNVGYSWHIDPESLQFAEFTVELCDGRPSYVEDGSLSGERFCPWTAEVVALEPAG